MRVDPKPLVRSLTPNSLRLLESAVGKAVSAQHSEVTVEHLLLALLEPEDGEAAYVLHYFEQNRPQLISRVEQVLRAQPGGHSGRPVFSQSLLRWLEDAWLFASLERGERRLRSGALLWQLVQQSVRYMAEGFPELEGVSAERLRAEFDDILGATQEAVETSRDAGERATGGLPTGQPSTGALSRFATNFTEAAREGRIDPIFGRHREIRQMIDVLARRRKNNPILVGEPGVGKTALVEGLALAIVQDEVGESLAGVELWGLDLGLLQAGASVKGEFENRLRAVIDEVKASAQSIVVFIDEAHTLIGAGGPQGGGDAANLLKPALARGEFRTVAATTWSEYKKYFEKDAALERRFQVIKVEEPSEENALVMLRGLRGVYEEAHQIAIRDEALKAAVELSHRYISGRQLPDKAVDLLDTTAARVRVEHRSRPSPLVAVEEELAALERHAAALERDLADEPSGPDTTGTKNDGPNTLSDQLAEVAKRTREVEGQRSELKERWAEQKAALERLMGARRRREDAVAQTTEADATSAATDTTGEDATASTEAIEREVREASAAFAKACGEDAILHAEVDADAVAQTVAAWTGVPAGKMLRDTADAVLKLEENISGRVVGQPFAIQTVAQTLRMAHAGIQPTDSPIGVLLFVGPSGVGKTETALALANTLYGGERFLTSINMSEFQEKHTVSRLIGSPPGYVGYGEGGVLTEAVRQRPYSVVLLDECEKADLEVMNLFYQVFDKGVLNDGEGRPINFRNTVLILTSNLASDQISAAFEGDDAPSAEELVETIRPTLSRHFKPALLARMTIVPFAPISEDAMERVARLKIDRLARRIKEAHKVEARFEDELVRWLVARCTASETGARNVDHVLRGTIMPRIANELLGCLADGRQAVDLSIGLDSDKDVRVTLETR